MCTTMHRILQRRKVLKLRLVWAAMAVVAMSLAACSVLFTAWTWRQTRDLSRSFRSLQERLEQVNNQRKEIFDLLLEKKELLEGQRVKRDGGTQGRGKSGRKVASHFEIPKGTHQASDLGVIKGWAENTLDMTRAVRYMPDNGTFRVERAGVYFLYCQVHFNENKSQYVKLEVQATPGRQTLQCMEGYGTTPSTGSHQFHFLKPCQVSGLLRLNKGAELQALTGRSFSLQNSGKHYFGLFRVN